MLFTAGAALAKRNQMLLLLGWVVLARRGLLFQCQQLNMQLHVVFFNLQFNCKGVLCSSNRNCWA